MNIIFGMNRLRAASRREDAFAQRLPLGEERQGRKEREFHALI